VGPFAEGLAAVRGAERTWGYVGRGGEEVIAPRFSSARPFARGLASVEVEGEGWGWIDRQGRWLWEPSF
jgi:hypothetical protein